MHRVCRRRKIWMNGELSIGQGPDPVRLSTRCTTDEASL